MILTLTSSEVRQLGKDPSQTIRTPESWGRGGDTHLGFLEGAHLIHCLNMIRKALHPNFSSYPNQKYVMWHSHLYHCQDALLKRNDSLSKN